MEINFPPNFNFEFLELLEGRTSAIHLLNLLYFICKMRSNNSTIKLSSSSMKTASEVSNVHFLPCKIQHNGEAKVDEYFQCSIEDEPDGKQQGLLFM